MSYIDSFDHEYIGNIGYLPIYHPLSTIEGDEWGAIDFGAAPDNLVLGGGSGEHPALVIHNLPSVVVKFLYFNLSEEDELTSEEEEYVNKLYYTEDDEILEFCGWSIRNFAELLTMSTSSLLGSPLKDDEPVEEWLMRSVGELIYFSLSDLNPEHEKIFNIFSRFSINANMQNVVCLPPGYPQVGGRLVKEGKITWGIHRWPKKR